jgi:hypothetical protein
MFICDKKGQKTPLVVAFFACQPNLLCSPKSRSLSHLGINPARFLARRTLFSPNVFD